MATRSSSRSVALDVVAAVGLVCAIISIAGACAALALRPRLDISGWLDIAAGTLGVVAAAFWLWEARHAGKRAALAAMPQAVIAPPATPVRMPMAQPLATSGDAPQLTTRPRMVAGEDPLFALPATGVARVFMQPKEGETLNHCQDFYAADPARGVYAVTDGVSTSFLPRPWASLIARAAVRVPDALLSEAAFTGWLRGCASAWHTWVTERWLPGIHAQQLQRGEEQADYAEMIQQKGAQTTLIVCALTPGDAATHVSLSAVGDAVALHARPSPDGWELLMAFPIADPTNFGVQPATLPTRDSDAERARAWGEVRRLTLTTQPGDHILLATDTLAEWLLRDPPARLTQLDALTDDAAYVALLAQEREAGNMKDDDMTVMIIPVM
jgi:hypothetical protein